MDSKKVRALITVAECGSITAAAEKLGYTQPGLTNMMNSLESELGLALLLRGKSGVKLTRDGWELLPSLKRFLQADDEISLYAARLIEKNSSTLRVGAFSSAARHWLPEILSRFRDLNLATNTAITATDIAETYNAVRSGSVDLAIASRQEELMKGLAWIPLHSDELVAILPKDYVSDQAGFPIEYFDEEEFLMPSGGFDMNILPALNANGHETKAHIRYTNLDDAAIASMVSHRLGFSILSELVMKGIHEDVRVLPLIPRATREMGIILPENRLTEPAISRFIDLARDTVAKLYGE